jgi:hypothetical protein
MKIKPYTNSASLERYDRFVDLYEKFDYYLKDIPDFKKFKNIEDIRDYEQTLIDNIQNKRNYESTKDYIEYLIKEEENEEWLEALLPTILEDEILKYHYMKLKI